MNKLSFAVNTIRISVGTGFTYSTYYKPMMYYKLTLFSFIGIGRGNSHYKPTPFQLKVLV